MIYVSGVLVSNKVK